MLDSKQVVILLAQHFKLSAANCEDPNHVEYMTNIPYSQVVSSIMYLMIFTRYDVSYLSTLISMYMAGKRHCEAAKWVFRYLKGSMNAQLIYKLKYVLKNCLSFMIL